MRHLFIINPAAGRKADTARLEEQLSRLTFPCEKQYTKGPGDAREIARRAVEQGEEIRIYACGGDGTLNEVVNAAAGIPWAAVTNVPKGTGNDFLKLFGPGFRSLFSDLEALAAGPQTSFDLMECAGMYGLDVICCGADARVAAGVHSYSRLPLVPGSAAYILSLAEQVFRGLNRPLSLSVDGREWSGEAAVFCICNGRHYGGGFMPVPEAMPDDGILDALLIPRVGLLTFASRIGRYAKGEYRKYPDLVLPFHGRNFRFSSPEEMTVVVDGEILRGKEFTVTLSEKKIRFFYPAGASWAVPEPFRAHSETAAAQ